MGFRRVNPRIIVTAKVMAVQSGLSIDRRTGISTERLEAHFLAGGSVMNVINAIIAAQRAEIDLDFDKAAAIDLAGRVVRAKLNKDEHAALIQQAVSKFVSSSPSEN